MNGFPTGEADGNKRRDSGDYHALIIIGGIVSGIFTPTESGAIAVIYALVIGMFVYKEFTTGTAEDFPEGGFHDGYGAADCCRSLDFQLVCGL